MGLFSGPKIERQAPAVEERATYRAPSVPAYIGSAADVYVDSNTAAQSVAIRTTADLIASLASELPITVYTGRGTKRREVATPSALDDPGGDGTGREDWGYRLLWSWLLSGNAFGHAAEVAELGRLVAVDLINPDDVTPTIVEGRAVWHIRGERVPDGEFQHWRVNPMPGRLLGLSPIEHHATTIGVSLATSRFGRQWFTEGAFPTGLLYNEVVDIDSEQAEIAKERIMASRGSRQPMVFGKGWKWENVQITPEESQFLQSQGLSEAQCARIFGPGFAEVLGFDSGGKSSITYTNIVDRRQDLLVLSMNRWIRRYERVLSRFTPGPQRVEVNRDAMLEATTIQRYQAHASALDKGWRSINEIREIEHLDPVPWGNTPLSQQSAQPANPAGSNDESDPGA